jgi:type VII secretion integral membrane protein EccD
LSASNELRRVCVHAGAAAVDLALPAGVPVAALIPSIVDILHGRASHQEASRYQLSLPGAPALAGPTSLAQNGIHDGAVLVLNQSAPAAPAPRHDDVAEAITATLGATAGPAGSHMTRTAGAVAAICLTGIGGSALIRTTFGGNIPGGQAPAAAVAASAGVVAVLSAALAHRAYRDPAAGLALGVIATVFAAVAGFLVVPGRPGLPNVLLAATAAALTSVLAMRVSGCGGVALTAVSGVAMVVAVAALAGVLSGAPPRVIGSVAALVCVGLLGTAGRVSIVLAGLSPRLDAVEQHPDFLAARAIRADRLVTGLFATFSFSAAVGAIVTVLGGAPHPGRFALAAVTGVLLLLRARAIDGSRASTLVVSGLLTLATTFGVVAIGTPEHGGWIAAMTATLAATAMYLGFTAPALSPSPVVHRGVDLLEWLALVAMAPLTCWICGAYGAVRGLDVQ